MLLSQFLPNLGLPRNTAVHLHPFPAPWSTPLVALGHHTPVGQYESPEKWSKPEFWQVRLIGRSNLNERLQALHAWFWLSPQDCHWVSFYCNWWQTTWRETFMQNYRRYQSVPAGQSKQFSLVFFESSWWNILTATVRLVALSRWSRIVPLHNKGQGSELACAVSSSLFTLPSSLFPLSSSLFTKSALKFTVSSMLEMRVCFPIRNQPKSLSSNYQQYIRTSNFSPLKGPFALQNCRIGQQSKLFWSVWALPLATFMSSRLQEMRFPSVIKNYVFMLVCSTSLFSGQNRTGNTLASLYFCMNYHACTRSGEGTPL